MRAVFIAHIAQSEIIPGGISSVFAGFHKFDLSRAQRLKPNGRAVGRSVVHNYDMVKAFIFADSPNIFGGLLRVIIVQNDY